MNLSSLTPECTLLTTSLICWVFFPRLPQTARTQAVYRIRICLISESLVETELSSHISPLPQGDTVEHWSSAVQHLHIHSSVLPLRDQPLDTHSTASPAFEGSLPSHLLGGYQPPQQATKPDSLGHLLKLPISDGKFSLWVLPIFP